MIHNSLNIYKRFLVILFLSYSLTGLYAQKPNPDYDSTLARKLGADDRGMKSYVLVILKTGPAKIEAGARRDSLFKGHFANINRMADQGKLVVAGPIGTNDKSYRGIFILNVKTTDEAMVLLQNDPTVKEKIFEAELYPWYGSAALSEYLEAAKKIEKTIN